MISVGLLLVFAGLLSESLPHDQCGTVACVCRAAPLATMRGAGASHPWMRMASRCTGMCLVPRGLIHRYSLHGYPFFLTCLLPAPLQGYQASEMIVMPVTYTLNENSFICCLFL